MFEEEKRRRGGNNNEETNMLALGSSLTQNAGLSLKDARAMRKMQKAAGG